MSSFVAPKSFGYEERAGIARITLSRPEKLNALTFEVYGELRDLFAALRKRSDVRVITITGQGRGFCSGGDVQDIIAELFSYKTAELLAFTRMTGELIENIRKVRIPVIASINGPAAGAGAVIALAADLRIVAENASFSYVFPQVGLAGADMGAAYLLPRVVGLGRATEILYFGEKISAARALEIGLANKVVSLDQLAQATEEWASKLSKAPGFAIAMTKEMLDKEYNLSLDQAIEAEAQAQAICMHHPDFQEAYHARQEKRAPRFVGACEE
jgi:enoyl-CoA hydratase/carnithine racemase